MQLVAFADKTGALEQSNNQDSVYGTAEIDPYCARPAKATFWVLLPIMCSVPGARSSLSPALPPRSRRACPRRPSAACRPAEDHRSAYSELIRGIISTFCGEGRTCFNEDVKANLSLTYPSRPEEVGSKGRSLANSPNLF